MSADDENGHEEGPTEEISGWADAMSKILGSNKPKKKKLVMLSRAKKDYEVVKKATTSGKSDAVIEVVPTDGSAPAEIIPSEGPKKEKGKKRAQAVDDDESEDMISLKKKRKLELQQKRIQKEWENINRVKPNPAEDRESERELLKIATKGVVELFNAVNLQKKSLGKKLRTASRSEFKKDKIIAETKDLFEDALEKVKKK